MKLAVANHMIVSAVNASEPQLGKSDLEGNQQLLLLSFHANLQVSQEAVQGLGMIPAEIPRGRIAHTQALHDTASPGMQAWLTLSYHHLLLEVPKDVWKTKIPRYKSLWLLRKHTR